MSWLFESGGQSIGASASASVIPMSIQGSLRIDWFDILAGIFSLSKIGIPQLVDIGSFLYCRQCVYVLVAQSCLTLCDPTDYSPPDFSVHGILQARILEWIAIPFSRGTSQPRDRTLVSCIAGRFFTV